MVVTWSFGALLLACLLAVVVGTTLGERRRGGSWPLAVAAGLVFPITWTVWYVLDERPYAPWTGEEPSAR